MSYQDYCARAHQVGHRVVTCVEHGFQGNYLRCWEAVQAFNAAQGADLKFVFGTEAYYVKDRKAEDKTNGHILILARNQTGVQDINEMLSEANETGFYYRPRVDAELLMGLNPKNVMVTTACVSGWGSVDPETALVKWHYTPDSPQWMEAWVASLLQHFGGSLYLEVQAHQTPWQKQVNAQCLKLHYALGIPLIAGLDSHYIYPEQREERKYLREKTGVYMGETDHELDDAVYEDYPDDETLTERFCRQGVLSLCEIRQAMSNADIALDFEDITFDRSRKLPTLYPALTQGQRNALYTQRVYDAWSRYKTQVPPEQWPQYEQGIAQEVDTVTSTGVSDYFLIAQESIAGGVVRGGVITPTSRGSAGSFFTNCLLGITTLDRFALPVKLYPERFVTAERLRTSIPDIDVNVSDQEPFVEAQRALLGEGHVYPMISYGTLKMKSAFKLYARANGMDAQQQNQITQQIDRYESALAHADEEEKDTIDIQDYVEAQYLPYIAASAPYRGIVTSKSPSPCAFMLYGGDIRREVGLVRVASKAGKKNCLCTVVDGYAADDFGFVKMDWLIVSVVDVNAQAMAAAGLPSYTSSQIIALTRNDKATWDIFARGLTQGINQCERAQTTRRIMQYHPRCLADLAAFVAAIRPGFKSQLNQFLNRSPFSYGIPSFDAMLKNDSSGSSWLLYQENLMECLHAAGFSLEETYPLIKAISKKKKEKITAAKARFLDGFAAHVVKSQGANQQAAQKAAETVWQVIEDSASYLFNAAHAVAVALDALYGAYLKAHYPLAYYVALLTKASKKGNKERMAAIRREMRSGFGITFSPPRFGQDNTAFTVDEAHSSISALLSSAKGLSARAAQALARLGQGAYFSFTQLLYDLKYERSMDSAKTETLIRLGYFSPFGGSAKLLKVFSAFNQGPLQFKKSYVENTRNERLRQLEALEESLPDDELPALDRLQAELMAYTIPLSLYPELKGVMGVVAVNDKFSVQLTLYNPRTGVTGFMRVKKNTFAQKPLKPGQIISIGRWQARPLYTYVQGQHIPVPGQQELWLLDYQLAVPAGS